MKVLCLHGMGTNGAIFEAQTASFRSFLPPHFTFDFLDAEHDSPAAEGIGEVYPAPYLCWYPVPTRGSVTDAHEFVWDVIREDGPFDAVMGFSQGAALAASVLLHHQISFPQEPPPFRLAIFICGSLPFSIDNDFGVDLTQLFSVVTDPISGDIKRWKIDLPCEKEPAEPPYFTPQTHVEPPASVSPIISTSSSSRGENSPEQLSSLGSSVPRSRDPTTPYTPQSDGQPADDVSATSLATKLTAAAKDSIRRFHSTIDTARIEIPTAHIYGRHDPYFSQSLELVNMCQSDLAMTFDHGGGHDIPRSAEVNEAIAGVIERTVTRSELMF